jgi:hypothetical protein
MIGEMTGSIDVDCSPPTYQVENINLKGKKVSTNYTHILLQDALTSKLSH